ncbi:MAG TPA: hypothetical protein VHS31_06710, partial [Tepidisphaeraceae bacterium]|nr:hypothetical protein [Tepidisphaeraceae bacterium]
DKITAKELRDRISTLENTGMVDLTDQREMPVRIVHLGLSRLNDLRDVPFHSFSERVNNIATYFDIDPAEAYDLDKAAELLVREKFQPRLEDIATELGAQ